MDQQHLRPVVPLERGVNRRSQAGIIQAFVGLTLAVLTATTAMVRSNGQPSTGSGAESVATPLLAPRELRHRQGWATADSISGSRLEMRAGSRYSTTQVASWNQSPCPPLTRSPRGSRPSSCTYVVVGGCAPVVPNETGRRPVEAQVEPSFPLSGCGCVAAQRLSRPANLTASIRQRT